MMVTTMVTFEDLGPQLTESDVRQFEWYLAARLPEQYREFLLTYNGGAPAPDTVDIQGLKGSASDVRYFFGIGRPTETECLDWRYEILRQHRIEAWQLPIASDSFGNAYILSLRDEDFGVITYCDLQTVYGKLDVKSDFYPVAPDFDTFLERLYEFRLEDHVPVAMSRARLEAMTNKLVGYPRTPRGYTWHHHQDGVTKQLVPKDVHRDTAHTGGSRRRQSESE